MNGGGPGHRKSNSASGQVGGGSNLLNMSHVNNGGDHHSYAAIKANQMKISLKKPEKPSEKLDALNNMTSIPEEMSMMDMTQNLNMSTAQHQRNFIKSNVHQLSESYAT